MTITHTLLVNSVKLIRILLQKKGIDTKWANKKKEGAHTKWLVIVSCLQFCSVSFSHFLSWALISQFASNAGISFDSSALHPFLCLVVVSFFFLFRSFRIAKKKKPPYTPIHCTRNENLKFYHLNRIDNSCSWSIHSFQVLSLLSYALYFLLFILFKQFSLEARNRQFFLSQSTLLLRMSVRCIYMLLCIIFVFFSFFIHFIFLFFIHFIEAPLQCNVNRLHCCYSCCLCVTNAAVCKMLFIIFIGLSIKFTRWHSGTMFAFSKIYTRQVACDVVVRFTKYVHLYSVAVVFHLQRYTHFIILELGFCLLALLTKWCLLMQTQHRRLSAMSNSQWALCAVLCFALYWVLAWMIVRVALCVSW